MPVPGESAVGEAAKARTRRASVWLRWLPLALLVLTSVSAYLTLQSHDIGFHSFAEHRAWMVAEVEEHELTAGLALFGTCVLVAGLSLPLLLVLTVFAGFLFGTLTATIWVVAGATLGSIVVFLAARGVLRETLDAHAGSWLTRLERGFRADAFSYLLVLRLLPIFPFWLVNLVPALMGMPFRSYVLGTALGLTPGTLVFAILGDSLGEMLDRGEAPDFAMLLDPSVLLPLLGLCLLSLAPVAIKRLWRKPTP